MMGERVKIQGSEGGFGGGAPAMAGRIHRRTFNPGLVAMFSARRQLASHQSHNDADQQGRPAVMIDTTWIAALESRIGEIAYTGAWSRIAGGENPMMNESTTRVVGGQRLAPR